MPWPVVLATTLLGTAGTALALGPETLGAEPAAAGRAILGASALAAASGIRHRRPFVASTRWRVVVSGGAAFAINQVAFFMAIERIGVAAGTVTTVATVPIAAGLLDWIFQRNRPPPRWWAGVAIAVAGVSTLHLGAGSEALETAGLAAATVAGTAGAATALAAQRLMEDRPMLPAMASVIGAGALLLVPTALVSVSELVTPPALATVAWLGLVTLFGAYTLLGIGLSRYPLATVGAATLMEPAVAALLAATIVGEPSTGSMWVGVALVVIGVGVATIGSTR